MLNEAYISAVKETFETKPLRTVLMIDDEFPTFADLASEAGDGSGGQFRQKERALALYKSFQARHMLCDVANSVSHLSVEHFRKSDLVILDYHLDPSAGHETSIRILCELANSKHFNTVVVYTAEPNQNEVWLDIMASLSAGWEDCLGNLEGDALLHWERLSDEDALPRPGIDVLLDYAQRRQMRDIARPAIKAAQDELLELGVPRAACNAIFKNLIYREMAERAGAHAGETSRQATGKYKEGPRWIQAENAFITILQKTDLSEDKQDPAGIMECLSQALLDWRPNLIQILTSEIQNILELEALTAGDEHLRDPVTQTALWYYLLNSLGQIDPDNPPADTHVLVARVIDKIVEGVRKKLISDSGLIAFASRALEGEIKSVGWTADDWPKPRTRDLLDRSSEIARTGNIPAQNTLFRLNSFFSTERFQRAHLTTGTVFRDPISNEYFVAASPACDLVSRQPGSGQAWAHAIYPSTPLVAILLNSIPTAGALERAERGHYVFLEQNGEQKAYRLLNDVNQPSYEFFFVEEEAKVTNQEGRMTFKATRYRQCLEEPMERELFSNEFEVVDQLRGINATRILQMAGQHLSRIGLDFMGMPDS